MILYQDANVYLHRVHRSIRADLLLPHAVLSTCQINGGLRNDLLHIVNHQSTEPQLGHTRASVLEKADSQWLHNEACAVAGTSPDFSASMGTAVNMDMAVVRKASFEDASVVAVVTAGVEGNAGRAGDPAEWHEPGTINIMLFLGQSIAPGAMARALITLTEAKTAALEQLSIASRYSEGLATGTGTDQTAIAAPLPNLSTGTANQKDNYRFHWAGNHTKLGQLIGETMRDAVLEAVQWQNRITVQSQASVRYLLGRFGIEGSWLLQYVDQDARAVACAVSLASIIDKARYGILPIASAQEAVVQQCALLACALGGRFENFAQVLESAMQQAQALPRPDNSVGSWGQFVGPLLERHCALGFAEKWAPTP